MGVTFSKYGFSYSRNTYIKIGTYNFINNLAFKWKNFSIVINIQLFNIP